MGTMRLPEPTRELKTVRCRWRPASALPRSGAGRGDEGPDVGGDGGEERRPGLPQVDGRRVVVRRLDAVDAAESLAAKLGAVCPALTDMSEVLQVHLTSAASKGGRRASAPRGGGGSVPAAVRAHFPAFG